MKTHSHPTTLVVSLVVCFLLTLSACAPEAAEQVPPAESEAEVQAETQAETNQLPRTPAPEGAEVYFITPQDGEVISGPVTVKFGLRGLGVAPAGMDVPNTGHHHLLVDLEELPAMDQPIPADDNHRHFGGGQTETTVELEPGTHTLQLLVGDKFHIPHEPPVMSERITITVE